MSEPIGEAMGRMALLPLAEGTRETRASDVWPRGPGDMYGIWAKVRDGGESFKKKEGQRHPGLLQVKPETVQGRLSREAGPLASFPGLFFGRPTRVGSLQRHF